MTAPFNLNLIRVLCAIIDAGSVSKAALHLDVNIAAISIALGKLREHYHDPLLFRSGTGMKPTALALDLYKLSQPALEILQQVESFKTPQNQRLEKTKIRIATGALVELWLMDILLENDQANSEVTWDVFLRPNEIPARVSQIRNKQIDIDIGFELPDDSAIIKFPLFHSDFQFVCRVDHPHIGDSITVEQIKQEWFNSFLMHVEDIGREMTYINIDNLKRFNRFSSPVNILLQVSTKNLVTLIPSTLSPWICKRFNLRVLKCSIPIRKKYSLFAHIHHSRKNDLHLQKIIGYFSHF